MTDQTIDVLFGAQVGPFNAGVDQVKAKLAGIGQSLSPLTNAFTNLGATAGKGLGAVGTGLNNVARGAKEATEGVTGMLGPIQTMRDMLGGVGEALIAAFAIKELVGFSQKMGEMGEKVEHTAERLGMTTGEVQRLGAIATLTGIDADRLNMAIGRLDLNFAKAREGSKQQVAAFKELGINISEVKNQSQLLDEVASHWGRLSEGIQQNAVAMQLFGRAGAALIPFLQQGKDGVDALNTIMEKYGVQNDDAIQKSASLGEAWNENKLATQGLNLVMAQSLAPTMEILVRQFNDLIANIIKSYQQGGFARQIFDGLAVVLKALATVIMVVSEAIYGLGVAFGALLEAMMAAAAYMQGDLSGAANHAQRAMNDLNQSVQSVIATTRALVGLWTGQGAGATPFKPPPIPKDQVEGLPEGTGKKKKAKKEPEEDALTKLKEQFDAEENTHNDMIRDMTADELAFWQKVAAGPQMATLNHKQQAEVRMNITKLEHAEAMKAIQEEIKGIQTKAEVSEKAVDDQLASTKLLITNQIDNIKTAEQIGTISRKDALNAQEELIAQEVLAEQSAAKQKYDIANAADIQRMQLAAKGTAEYQSALDDQEKAYRKYQDDLTQAARQGEQQRLALERQAAQQFADQWSRTVTGLVNVWSNGFVGMIEGTTSFKQVWQAFNRQLLADFFSMIASMVARWIISHTLMAVAGIALHLHMIGAQTAADVAALASKKATAAAQIPTLAGLAGAGGVASMAAAPFPIDLGAPEFGMAMSEAALAFGSVAAAEGGWGDVPSDQLAFIHQNEMVLPATIASPLRDALSEGGGLNAGPVGRTFDQAAKGVNSSRSSLTPNVNLHYYPTINHPDSNLKGMLESQGREMTSWLKKQSRNGAFRQ